MVSLPQFMDDRLAHGRAYFARDEAIAALDIKPPALAAALTRLIKKRRLVSPRQGFYLILRPEDRMVGAPDPVDWVGPMMRYLGVDYRISLLRAAAFHGASHQAAMVFQLVVPQQMRAIEIGRLRIQFIYLAPSVFTNSNQPALLSQIKSDAGYAQVAGIELTLLDCARYFHQAAGINGVAQIVKDIGGKAKPRQLAQAAAVYERSTVLRLGYLLDLANHARQAAALASFAKQVKSAPSLDPSVKSLMASARHDVHDAKWKLVINTPVDVDF